MKAVIITIGDEILLGQILDTNSQFIARELTKLGAQTVEMRSVGDTRDEILSALTDTLKIADTVIITGGEKDVMTLAAHGFTALAFNSESAKITDSQMNALAERFHHIVFMFDCDTTGKRESAARMAEFSGRFNVSQLILPLSGTKREKDISDYFLMGHTPVDLMLLIEKSLNNLN